MRDSKLRCAIRCATAVALAGCSASGSDEVQHGPSFDLDGATPAADATVPGDAAPADAAVPPIDAPPVTDASSPDGAATPPPVDAGVDASPPIDAASPVDAASPFDAPGAPDAAACASTAALVAGGAASLYLATYASGRWGAGQSLAGASASSTPAIVTTSGGFFSVFVRGDGSLASTTFAGALTVVGSATARDAPALGVVGSGVELVYQGSADFKFYQGAYDASAWDAADTPVGYVGDAGLVQSFGPSGPSAAAVGSTLVVVQGGQDGTLYDQAWTGGAWAPASPHAGTSVEAGFRPTLVALTGGTADLLVVYLRTTDHHLMWTARTGGSWGAAVEIYDTPSNVAFSNDPVSLAPLAGGGAVVAFRGSDGNGYFATWSGGATWTAPAPIVPGGSALASPPAVAAGICGSAALAALVGTGGGVSITELEGTLWTAPAPVSTVGGATYVAIATAP